MDASETSNVLGWQIRLHKPAQFDNPDWHGIQSVLVREFGEAIWSKISGTVFDHMEMTLIPFIKQPLTVELLTQISAVAKSLAPEAKSSIYPEFWRMFAERIWPGIRTGLEGLIKDGKPGGIISAVVPNKLAFTINFVAPVYLFPREWEAPNICFVMKDIVIRGIIPIVVSLEPQLGSPMN
jgi:hypothetical protein